VQIMLIQLIGTLGPYFTSLIGGGLIIVLTLFLIEYQKRSELTSQLIKVLSIQQSTLHERESEESMIKTETPKTDTTITPKPNIEIQVDSSNDERYYWKG
jgi:hypothetical protein